MRVVGAWVLAAAVGFLLAYAAVLLLVPPRFWGLIPLILAACLAAAAWRLIPRRSWVWIVAAVCCLGGGWAALMGVFIGLASST